MKWMKKEVAMKRNQLRILRTLSLAFIALLCLSLPAYADMGPKPDLTVTVVNAPEGLCYVDLLYEGGGDDLHSDFDTSGCDQKLIASLHTLEGDGWTLALTTGISSGPPIFGDLTPNSDGAYHYSYHGQPRTFRLAVATEEGIQATQESYTRTRFHTSLVYDWITNTVSEVTPSLVYYTAQFLATFVPTLIIEGIILWLFKFRQKRTWLSTCTATCWGVSPSPIPTTAWDTTSCPCWDRSSSFLSRRPFPMVLSSRRKPPAAGWATPPAPMPPALS